MRQKGQSEKTPNGTVNDGLTLVLDYLRKQNRPYSATDISANLQNKVTKTYAAKALRELHQNRKIEGRASGRQAVYHALQKGTDESTLEGGVVLEDHICKLQEQLTDLKGYAKRARAELTTLRATPLAFDLQESINQLQVEKETTFAILTQAQGTSAGQVDEDRTVTKRAWECWQKRVKLRRQICRDLWGRYLEMVDKDVTREELWVLISG
ncbi:Tat binding protein 1-interacting protein-domain-containing protein [Aspergillus caelatus]|uniref:Tat binding protein 1-interacting protein-domain-containing protein n=1 Tax=Aspergillus caelatus TaxID=61420 RepID=A0A5N7A1B2_9EURO|nr:Tat binding protein 1-interacting protein-domain-containing protein [Aspergillus caelatus]KAE8362989.1 Tat binding protein 1-interacting protein-domain-containing protein [Aspergillus caelatus]